MEKVEGTGRIKACIERVFGYKAHVNLMFLNTSRLLEITDRERNELLLSVKNLHELGSSPFPYITPFIPRPLESLKPRSLKGPWLASSGSISHLWENETHSLTPKR